MSGTEDWSFPEDLQPKQAEQRFDLERVFDAMVAIRAEVPEDAFTASLASCHMLTFLAIAAVKGFAVASYADDAVGTLDKNAEGRMSMVRVVLRPRVVFEGRQPTLEELNALHERAHKGCFIANSVKTEVSVEPQLN